MVRLIGPMITLYIQIIHLGHLYLLNSYKTRLLLYLHLPPHDHPFQERRLHRYSQCPLMILSIPTST